MYMRSGKALGVGQHPEARGPIPVWNFPGARIFSDRFGLSIFWHQNFTAFFHSKPLQSLISMLYTPYLACGSVFFRYILRRFRTLPAGKQS